MSAMRNTWFGNNLFRLAVVGAAGLFCCGIATDGLAEGFSRWPTGPRSTGESSALTSHGPFGSEVGREPYQYAFHKVCSGDPNCVQRIAKLGKKKSIEIKNVSCFIFTDQEGPVLATIATFEKDTVLATHDFIATTWASDDTGETYNVAGRQLDFIVWPGEKLLLGISAFPNVLFLDCTITGTAVTYQ